MPKRISFWTVGAILVIALFTFLLIIKWKSFPIFLDLYYHASCMKGFEQAGGLSLYDFWNYAPVGRPHLYPPFLPIVMLGLYKTGLSVITITRLLSVIIYPAVLMSIWWVARTFYSESEAFFILAAATIPYTFFLTVVNAIPASLGLIILLFLFYALEKKKILAAALLLGGSFYIHSGLPWIGILALVLYGLVKKDRIRPILIIIVGGIFLGSPWLAHLVRYKDYFLLVRNRENFYFEGNILIYIFAISGIFIAAKRKELYYIPLALFAAMLPTLINYRYRFLCGQGLLPLIFFTGFTVDKLYHMTADFLNKNFNPSQKSPGKSPRDEYALFSAREGASAKRPSGSTPHLHVRWSPEHCVRGSTRRIYIFMLPALFFYMLTFFAPGVAWDLNEKKLNFLWRSSTFTNFVSGYRSGELRGNEATICNESFTKELKDIVEQNSRSEDIIYCNYSYFGGLLSALTGRVLSCGMLNEVRPASSFNPFLPASLIVLIKNPEGTLDPPLRLLIKDLSLEKIAETDIAYVYKNPFPTGKRKVVKAAVQASWVFLTGALWLGLLLWGFAKNDKKVSSARPFCVVGGKRRGPRV